MRQSRDGLILVKGEDDGHLHVRVDVPAAFASGFEFPFRYSLHGCRFKFALRHFDGKRILDIAVGIDDEVDDDFSPNTRAVHLRVVGRATLQAGDRLVVEHGRVKHGGTSELGRIAVPGNRQDANGRAHSFGWRGLDLLDE